MYNEYGRLYVWRDKNGDKYQFHPPTNQFMNDKNQPISNEITQQLKKHPILKMFYDPNNGLRTPTKKIPPPAPAIGEEHMTTLVEDITEIFDRVINHSDEINTSIKAKFIDNDLSLDSDEFMDIIDQLNDLIFELFVLVVQLEPVNLPQEFITNCTQKLAQVRHLPYLHKILSGIFTVIIGR